MDNNSTETAAATLISQKENKPPLAKDGRKGPPEVGIIASELQTISTSTIQSFREGGFENPLKARNMAAQVPNQKTSDQMQLLEKFKKLRQWQQQQQESMFRQQQQQMEAFKMEQNKVQSIVAMQKRFQEQRSTFSPTQQPPPPVITLNPQYIRQENPLGGQRQLVQNMEVLSREDAELSNNNTNGGAIPNSSSTLSWSSVPNSEPVQLADGASLHQAGNTVMQQQDYSHSPRHSSQHDLKGTLSSFNKTLYPTILNSSNYGLPPSLPLGTMPLSVIGEVASQGCYSIPQLVGGRNVYTTSSQMGTNTGAVPEAASSGAEELERLWRHSPRGETDSYVESLCDNQSEGDTMSGVYPLYDSECENGGSEVDKRSEHEWDARSKAEEELVEGVCQDEPNRTAIENLPERATKENEDGNEIFALNNGGSGHEERRPIKPGIGGSSTARTFEQLLEEQLKLDELKASSTAPSSRIESQPPHRPFLRKGQGLARYQGKKKSSKVEASKCGSTSQAAPPAVLRKPSRDVPPQPKQDTQRNAPAAPGKVTRKIASKSLEDFAEGGQQPTLAKQQIHGPSLSKTRAIGPLKSATESAATKTTLVPSSVPPIRFSNAAKVLTSSIDASFQMRLKEWEQHQEIEEEELEEFELLEQAAANASFSSNSSVVVKVLAKARGYAPPSINKIIREPPVKSVEDRGNVLSPVDTGYGSEEGKVAFTAKDVEETTRTRIGEYEESEKGSEDEDDDVTLQEISLDSALDLGDGEEGYNQQQTKCLEDKAKSYPVSTSSLALEEDFNDEETWGEIKSLAGRKSDKENDDDDDDDDSDVTISDIFPLVSSTPPMHLKGVYVNSGEKVSNRPDELVTSTPPTSALVTKLFPQLKPKQKSIAPAVQSVSAHAPCSEEKERSSVPTVQSQAVREKLKQLETEIEKFRAENAALAKMRVEREEGLTKLHNEIAAFEKQKAEELERLETFREEELKKLRRERRVFEKYQKAARAIPDKKEREEIEGLRGQVVELQEELKRRESRWSAASTRYRQKVESLEQNNKELQEELRVLEQYRLQQWREEEEHTKAKEAEDTRGKKSFQRKTAKATEEETGPRLIPSRDPPPIKPSLFEAELKSTPEALISSDRSSALDKDPKSDKTAGLDITEVLSKAEEESLEVLDSTRIIGSSCENQSSKRSPRRRKSKTPDSGEKKRKNVRFQDENKVDFNETSQGSSSAEMKEMTQELEILHADGKAEKVNIDGSRVISFANGTRKVISADGQTVTVNFFNGDIKQLLPDQRVVYYYSDAQTTHTTYPDGLEVLQFPSKQIEKHYRGGAKEIIFPDQTVKYLYPNGAEECIFSDGTIQRVSLEGDRIIEFPNGQRETHTKYYKKREYPDGTVKTVYPDGRTETRYATGRVRVRDRDGRVLVDTAEQNR